MELLKFTDDTYCDDSITMSSSDKKCIKRKCINCSTRKAFLEKGVVELIYIFDKKSYREGESIAKVRFNFFFSTNI